MKTVYFVRHGESESNAAGVTSQIDSPLTEKGKSQAEFVAVRALRLDHVDLMISSTQMRAKQTAQIISSKINLPITFSDLFVERRRPASMRGLSPTDPEWQRLQKIVKSNFDNADFHIGEEENFHDLITRAKEALVYLEEQKEDSILVVSHGYFMTVIVAYIIFGEDLTATECLKMILNIDIENTGLTVLTHGSDVVDPKWKLWIWNDHAHLG